MTGNEIDRAQKKTLNNRLNEPRKFIQVILGPRQVGKTTMVLQVLKKLNVENQFYSADNVTNSNPNWIEQIWEAARFRIKQQELYEMILVIDEIQKIANWSEVVKKLWDEDSRNGLNLKIVLLGSARLLIQDGLSESLAGRFEVIHMTHWSFKEMKEAFGFTVEQYIYFGSYPGAASLIEDEQRWKNYVRNALIETTISKDILMLTRVDKPALLKRLFELGCLYSGQIIAFNKLLGDLQDAGNTTTLSHYIDLLSDSGLLGKIDKYAGTTMRQRASKPKFQVYNTALWSAQQGYSFDQLRMEPKIWGRIVESTVGAHLMNAAMAESIEVYYWREKNEEVDFILKKDDELIALEVKSGKNTSAKGISAFSKLYPTKKKLLVGGDGITIEEFLSIEPADLF
jgi:predicted AAA+ superfamily ATPase